MGNSSTALLTIEMLLLAGSAGEQGEGGFSLGAEGVLPGRQIESLVRVCNQFAPTLPSG